MSPRKHGPSERSADRVYAALRDAILKGDYENGGRLTEEVLAERFRVSRTPIRAALAKLAGDGFIDMIPHAGAVVRRRTIREVSEVYAVRALLESAGAGLAATLRTDADVAVLGAICDEMEARSAEDRGVEILSTLNKQLHHRILEISGNQTLRDTADRLMDIGFLIHSYTKFQPRDLGRSFADHRDLVSAIASRDAEWAASVMRAHILAARNTLLKTMTDLPEGSKPARDDAAL
ncbi:MAG TPA: GntR family transcriptional regulator [Aurantimonas sp.]|uniref:GntR family transcriptional regulator n=1 Tax=Aurantimonas marianensis TaxID=2920428 RepID=A0A9X2KGC3_9HYPH|nr:GntR family transcriptional regulator [Aurantimonas marianensis]MCP3056679.1 GntR family transcriptional regulator [Aurantimonas marianensis]